MNAAAFLVLTLLLLAFVSCQPNQKPATIIEDATPASENIIK